MSFTKDASFKPCFKKKAKTFLDVKFAKAKIGYWRNGELVYMLQLLRKLEYGIKVGSIEESYAIDYFMIDMF